MVAQRRYGVLVCLSTLIAVGVLDVPAAASGGYFSRLTNPFRGAHASLSGASVASSVLSSQAPAKSGADSEYRVRLAFGRTFGTSTSLDYTTVEVSRRISDYVEDVLPASGKGQFQLSLLASHVSYKGGHIERIKRLDFHDGYELGVLPKAIVELPVGPLGMQTYLESGAGIGYVSETYRNSGSRWNWSLLAGLGMERALHRRTSVTVGLLWRHLSNGNMWGKGDELHNSNSGTDMIQGTAAFVHRF
ncbi:MAG: acyloxyacyl hydrolase [Desulfomonile sp.]|nr:acyloxyacyl hydrolase [Desulfomonile sp.]